jgi:hypothetical protein
MTDSRPLATLVMACLALSPLAADAQSQLGGSRSGPSGPSDMSTLKPPVKKPGDAAAPSGALAPQAAPSGPAKFPQSTARFQVIKAGDRTVDLRTAPDSEVLTAKNGRTITVGRLKELQGAMAAKRPIVAARPGQSLAALAAQPQGTRVLVGGRLVRSEDLGQIAALRAKLAAKRTPKPVPSAQQHANAKPNATVGPGGITMAEALKRPGNEVIQVGSLKFSAEQLRQIDAGLKASAREPLGLAERVGRGGGASKVAAAPKGPVALDGPRMTITPKTTIPEVLARPDNTVLQAPNGRAVTVGQIKQYMAREKITAAQLAARYPSRSGK